jgi:hypothetical protein
MFARLGRKRDVEALLGSARPHVVEHPLGALGRPAAGVDQLVA